MDVGDYAAGCVALSLTVLPWPVAAHRTARWLLPEWTGAARALVVAVLSVSGVLVVAEVLGMLGAFSRWWMAAGSAAAALAVIWRVPRAEAVAEPATALSGGGMPSGRTAWIALGLALVAALAVSAALLGRDARALTTGPTDADSLDYHLSDAAWFVQTHSIDHLHQTASSDAAVYYPFDVELLDGVAMLGPRPDIATFGLNVGFAWLALLACWVIGARWEMGSTAVAAGSAVLAVPLIAGAASGPGLNDIPATATLLAGIAILVHGRVRAQWLRAAAVAGLALGLAAGTKLPTFILAVLVGLAVVACAASRRWATAGVVTVTAFVTGGFWFVRDWVAAGSPFPSVDLTVAGHGLHQVPYPQVKPFAFSVAHYLGNGSVVRHQLVPALKVVMTPAWPALLGLPLLGALAALLLRGDALRRALGAVVLVGVASYLVTPTTALGPPGHPVLFAANLRYIAPELVLGIVLLVTAAPLRRHGAWLTAVFAVATLGLLGSTTTSAYVDRWRGVALAAVLVPVVAWLVTVLRRSPSRLVTVAVAVFGLLLLANAGALVQRHYLDHRYAAATPPDRLFALGRTVSHARIGIVGHPLQYPLTGPTLANTVSYVGVEAPDHSFAAPTSCGGWTRALRAGRYQYVVFEQPTKEPVAQLLAWTATAPGARVEIIPGVGAVIALPSAVSRLDCAAS